MAAAAHHFLFPGSPVSENSLPAGAAPPTQTLSPNNPPPQPAGLRPPFSQCPAPKPSAPAPRFPARASTAKMRAHPAPATRRPAAPGPAVREATPLAPLPPTPPPQFDTSPPAPFAGRISPWVRRLRSESSSWFRFLTSSLLLRATPRNIWFHFHSGR